MVGQRSPKPLMGVRSSLPLQRSWVIIGSPNSLFFCLWQKNRSLQLWIAHLLLSPHHLVADVFVGGEEVVNVTCDESGVTVLAGEFVFLCTLTE